MTMILVRVFNTGKAEQAYLSEFEVNLVYIVKVCLKLKKKKKMKSLDMLLSSWSCKDS